MDLRLRPRLNRPISDGPISVVIPTRNEALHLPRLLGRLNAMPEVGEIWVSDGGSEDETVELARALGAQVVATAQGRGPQLNAGAARCEGEFLWFLHADGLPARGCGAQILRSRCVAGNFRLRFQSRARWPRFFERVARTQRALGVYYGDSGLWMRREVWGSVGPFPAWPLFEDYEMARRLQKFAPTACLPGPLWASARRFEGEPARVLRLWIELQIRFSLGESPEKLALRYRSGSGKVPFNRKTHSTSKTTPKIPPPTAGEGQREGAFSGRSDQNSDARK